LKHPKRLKVRSSQPNKQQPRVKKVNFEKVEKKFKDFQKSKARNRAKVTFSRLTNF